MQSGLVVGASDLIGWTSLEITGDMVGKTLAIFTGVEAKSKRGKAKEHQVIFKDLVNKNGGIAVVARSVEEYELELQKIILALHEGDSPI